MYRPLFNKVLVEIDDKDAKWGSGSDDTLGGVSYREGKVVSIGLIVPTSDYPFADNADSGLLVDSISDTVEKQIMWHEGHEAGTVFEENDKKYALIFWWDIIGVKDGK